MKGWIAGAVLALGWAPSIAHANPAPLSHTPVPIVTVKGRTVQDVQNSIVAFMLPAGRTPVRQDQNVMVYEFPLSFWHSVGVQMTQGNSGWQEPKGRSTFTLAQIGPDVMVSNAFETVATNMFNASNSVQLTNPVVYNENYLGLQLIAAMAEGRFTPGDHNALGITAYKKPTRKTRKVGAVIDGLVPGGPAEQAGLIAGDVITHIGGVPLAEQSPTTIQMLGYLQLGEARLEVQGKGEVVLIKRQAPGVATPSETATAGSTTANLGDSRAGAPVAVDSGGSTLLAPSRAALDEPVPPTAAPSPAAPQSWWNKQKEE